jgi:hypothetical protein
VVALAITAEEKKLVAVLESVVAVEMLESTSIA